MEVNWLASGHRMHQCQREGKTHLLPDTQPHCQPAQPARRRGQCSWESASFICIAFASAFVKGRQLALASWEVSAQPSDALPEQGNSPVTWMRRTAEPGKVVYNPCSMKALSPPSSTTSSFFKWSISNYSLWIY